MILRRLTTAFRKQDWFTVGVETLIVVFGVFIGLQVNNWNEARGDRVDELSFLERLHPDIVRVEDSSARVRDRRIAVIHDLRSATEIIFGVAARDQLTQVECMALATSHYYNINVRSLPSVVELENSGRISIIRDAALRTALVEYEQRVDTFTIRQNDQSLSNNLLMLNPQLVKVAPVFDAELGEMQTLPVCDLAAMREDQAFLNAVAENLDAYDAYLRDGLLPWDAQLKEVHRLVDRALGITHEGAP
jgi:hypothetical protein